MPFSWTGFYAGYNAGYGWGDNSARFSGDNPAGPGAGNLFVNLPFGLVDVFPAHRSQSLQTDGWLGGAQIGYNRQIGPAFLAGVEVDIQKSWLDGDTSTSSAFASLTSEQRLDWFATARARLGVVIHERLLAFVSGGLAYGKTDVSSKIGLAAGNTVSVSVLGVTDLNCGSALAPTVCLAGSSSKESFGWTAGGGFEWAFTPSMTMKVEYLHIDLENQSFRMIAQSPATGNGFATAKFDNAFDVVRGGVNFRF